METSTNNLQEKQLNEGLESSIAGKFMTFRLDQEEYGVEILNVREIIGLMDITRVPRTTDHIRGVINLRGKVIPVIDLRVKFGMESVVETEHTVIIVVQYQDNEEQLTMGVLVDEVLEVVNILPDMLSQAPSLGSSEDTAEFLLGVGKLDERMIFLLDINKVILSRTEGVFA